LTTDEEIAALEAALAEIPIGVTSITDAAGNKTTFDRDAVTRRIDTLRGRATVESGMRTFGISKLVSGGANDG